MEYYNSQCLLHNLVRENNLLKSQINSLSNIIANNKSSTSENTSSENATSRLSKDELTQLIQNTDPKEHEHTSSQISDRISKTISDDNSQNADPIIECKLPQESVFHIIKRSNYDFGFKLSYWDTYSFTIVNEGNEYQINQSTPSGPIFKGLKLYQGDSDGIIYVVTDEITQSINMIIKDIVKDGWSSKTENITIKYSPGYMNSDKCITANAMRKYVNSKLPNIYNLKDILICDRVAFSPVYIPLCLASTPYFECKCLIRCGGCGEVDNLFSETAVQTASADVIYSSSQFYPCRIIGYNLRIDETQRGKGTSMYLHFQLIVFTKDSKEIVCLKITYEPGMSIEPYYPWEDGHFLITYQEMINDVITAKDIKEEKVVKSCDFYPSVCDKIDLLEKKITELEKKVSDLEGAGA